ncbi:E3 ubiquitin-protein ligase TRIM47-like [Labeo rohita]|uniref:E3 ubiquitin-protein ligase TRIM47-like n=1 Tax=Labeo rohita TaxID=84645 RepID=UPI0021E26616|nr:E3 ubiquitin-protein ligase TRIM47-like [Labeo rohita]
MASSSGPLNKELHCSICLDVFTDPVTTPCGHNFCRTCLDKCWTNTQIYCCPSCKETFSRRPDLEINTTSGAITGGEFRMAIQRAMIGERGTGKQPLLRGTNLHLLSLPQKQILHRPQVNVLLRGPRNHSDTSEYNAESFAEQFQEKLNLGKSDVFCDFCVERKQKAVKSCLTCQSSYCETHLEPHHRVPRLKKHKLINAVKNLDDYIYQKHEKPLEVFCRDDQTCVCLSCTEGGHRTHNSVPVKEKIEQKKALPSEVESAARALIDVLARGLDSSSSNGLTPLPTLTEPENRLKQALKRQFQSMLGTENDQPRRKKRFSVAKPGNVKKTDFLIYVLSEPTLSSPKDDEDLKLLHAGLGKKLLTLPDSFKHNCHFA